MKSRSFLVSQDQDLEQDRGQLALHFRIACTDKNATIINMINLILSFVFAATSGVFQFKLQNNQSFYKVGDIEFVADDCKNPKHEALCKAVIRSVHSPKKFKIDYGLLGEIVNAGSNSGWFTYEEGAGSDHIKIALVDLEKGKQALVTEHSNADGEGGSNRIYVFDVDEKKRLKSNLVLAFEDSFVWSEHPYFEFVRHKDRYETIKYHSDKLDEKQRKKESFSLHYDPKTKKFNKKLLETTKTNR